MALFVVPVHLDSQVMAGSVRGMLVLSSPAIEECNVLTPMTNHSSGNQESTLSNIHLRLTFLFILGMVHALLDTEVMV